MNTMHVAILPVLFTSFITAQEVYTIDSNADDADSYAYDDPNTPVDESKDGVCSDKNGRCTLRAAVNEAHNRKTSAIFKFSISGTINLNEPITLEDHCEIDGGNQVELSSDLGCLELYNHTKVTGLKFSKAITAIEVYGDSNQIGDYPGRNEFLDNGVAVQIDGNNNSVYNNYFGLTINEELHPNQIGVLITGSSNIIGGNTYGQKNIICGNAIAGISLNGDSHNNLVFGNFIGTNFSGASGLGNMQGVVIGGSRNNWIGGIGEFEGNVISGNTAYGIFISADFPDNLSEDNWVFNNIIGLTPDQTAAVPNGTGITVTNGAHANHIGKNIVAGNTYEGISFFAYDADSHMAGHTVLGNHIGINTDGALFPNGGIGIAVFGNVDTIIIGTNDVGEFFPNIITGNSGGGISVQSMFGFSPKIITVRKNNIYQNSGFNFSVENLSNNGIQPPYSLSCNDNTIAGIHNLPNVIIDVYKESETEVHASATQWLGSTTTDANGIFAFNLSDPAVEAVSLTATSVNGNTSNFASLELLTDVKKEVSAPAEYMVAQNYPNPFNPTTTIRFGLPQRSTVMIKIYDGLGREVSTPVNGVFSEGYHEIVWNGALMPSGMYLYRMIATSVGGDRRSFTQIKKLLLMK